MRASAQKFLPPRRRLRRKAPHRAKKYTLRETAPAWSHESLLAESSPAERSDGRSHPSPQCQSARGSKSTGINRSFVLYSATSQPSSRKPSAHPRYTSATLKSGPGCTIRTLMASPPSFPSRVTGMHAIPGKTGSDSTERWLPVPGYEGFYEVSDRGRVRSVRHQTRAGWRGGRLLAQFTDADGYFRVNVSRLGIVRSRPVHALVLLAFKGAAPESGQGCHGPRGRSDNSLSNLYWGTAQENSDDKYRDGTMARGERQGNARLRAEDVRAIRTRHAVGEGQSALASEYGISQAHVSRIVLRQTWKHVP